MNWSSLKLLGAMMLATVGRHAGAQSAVPVLELAPADAASTHQFGLILNVRSLADGRVLVNDGGSCQLLVLDAALSNPMILLDSAAGSGTGYGPRASPFIPYLGDSTLFVDGQSSSLLLISPAGKLERVSDKWILKRTRVLNQQ